MMRFGMGRLAGLAELAMVAYGQACAAVIEIQRSFPFGLLRVRMKALVRQRFALILRAGAIGTVTAKALGWDFGHAGAFAIVG